MRFIGDVHAKFDRYLEVIADCQQSIQVGDFGVGFRPVPEIAQQHRFIRGNHDDPNTVGDYNWIPDGTVEGDMFFLGGGHSIDRHSRTEGVDWWSDEELSMGELYRMMDIYEEAKPRVLVSHECPSDVVNALFAHNHVRVDNPSRTSQALGSMLYIHRPEIVIFGHWHKRADRVIEGTRFICLEELGYIDL